MECALDRVCYCARVGIALQVIIGDAEPSSLSAVIELDCPRPPGARSWPARQPREGGRAGRPRAGNSEWTSHCTPPSYLCLLCSRRPSGEPWVPRARTAVPLVTLLRVRSQPSRVSRMDPFGLSPGREVRERRPFVGLRHAIGRPDATLKPKKTAADREAVPRLPHPYLLRDLSLRTTPHTAVLSCVHALHLACCNRCRLGRHGTSVQGARSKAKVSWTRS